MNKNEGTEARVQVVSDLIGSNGIPKGAIVPASTFGADLPRLLDIGAIVETDQPVDWHTPGTTVTLQEALHSESPPTLPNAPYVDASRDEIRAKLGPGAPPDAGIQTARTSSPYGTSDK